MEEIRNKDLFEGGIYVRIKRHSSTFSAIDVFVLERLNARKSRRAENLQVNFPPA
jgi:hypothetical protein